MRQFWTAPVLLVAGIAALLEAPKLPFSTVATQRPNREVRVVGSAIIARFMDSMLDEPKPTPPVRRPD